MKQSFTIPGRFLSLNEFYRLSPMDQNRKKQEADDLVAWCAKAAKIKPRTNPIKYHTLWIEQNHRRDLDNVAFAKKFIQDGLVNAGILKDDSSRYIKGFSDDFAYDPRNPRIIVEIEDVN